MAPPILLAAALSAGQLVAPLPSTATIAQEAQAVLDRTVRPDGPGAVVLIARGDEVIVRLARGRAQIELDVPLAADQVFRIASVTKIFVAASIVKLAETGRLSLDDALAKHLSDLPGAGAITIRQLLSHTAGISDVATKPQPGGRRDVDRAARLAEIRSRPLDFPPGTSWRYSNSGYILLGAVIERVTGEPWHVTLQKQFLDPLGLTRTRYGDTTAIVGGRVAGYTTNGRHRAVTNATVVSAAEPDAAGALVSTADDLLRWMRALSGGRAISRDGFRQMTEAVPTGAVAQPGGDYGLGVFVWRVRGQMMIGHTGQIPGFASVVGYLPQHDITIVALGNDDNFDARAMGRRLAAIAVGQPYPEVTAVRSPDAELQALAGIYRIDDHTVRTLSVKDGTLYAQRGSGNVIPLQVTASGHLHFDPDELTYFVPVRDAAGRIVRLDYHLDGEDSSQSLSRLP